MALVRVEMKKGCAWVTLDRPPLNLIVPDLIVELRAAFDALAHDPSVHRVVQAINEQSLVAEPMEQLERPVRRLGNAMKRHQAEPSMKRH